LIEIKIQNSKEKESGLTVLSHLWWSLWKWKENTTTSPQTHYFL
jgi:hypothetical protein